MADRTLDEPQWSLFAQPLEFFPIKSTAVRYRTTKDPILVYEALAFFGYIVRLRIILGYDRDEVRQGRNQHIYRVHRIAVAGLPDGTLDDHPDRCAQLIDLIGEDLKADVVNKLNCYLAGTLPDKVAEGWH